MAHQRRLSIEYPPTASFQLDPRNNRKQIRQLASSIETLGFSVRACQLADAIIDCTARGDLVLKLFLGSGTTLTAAEPKGRVSYSVELDPHYTDTMVRRWQPFTGQNAVQESAGRAFNNIEQEDHGRAY